jgi:UDPglucose 6-dehydrogenase/UDP-N-acetyl-D-galactosamine dehydrogenase
VERVRIIVQAMKEFSHPGTKEKTPINLNKAIQNTITIALNEWKYVAEMAIKGLNKVGKTIKGSNVLIMGLTYKEDVADIRESPVENMVHELKEYDVNVYGYDPLLPDSVIAHFGTKPLPKLDKKMDAVIIAVAHTQFRKMGIEEICRFMNPHPVLVDVRGMVDHTKVKEKGIYYKKL